MLRGESLAPQQRLGKDPQELPTELVNSIIGVSAHASPDYGGTGNINGSSAASLSTSAQQQQQQQPAAASSSFLTRLFRVARRRYQPTNLSGQVPIFDVNGSLTTSQTGVNMFRFRSLSLFYFFRAQSWTVLITYSILLYLFIVLIITAAYYLWAMYCGAGLNMVASIYFTVVSLAANGGYLGEDEDTMTDSTHVCYRGRTAIVMVCSYVNIVFVGLVAALVVGKAEYTGKLGHRVVFSDFCTLTSIPGRVGQYRLNFRMANVDNNIPLAHGLLRLFCVTAEPLQEYRLRQKQMRLLKNSAPLTTLGKTTYGKAQQLLPAGEATNNSRAPAQPQPQPLTNTMLEGRRATHQRHNAHGQQTARAQQQQQQQRRRRHDQHRRRRDKGRGRDQAGSGSGSRGRHSRRRATAAAGATGGLDKADNDNSGDRQSSINKKRGDDEDQRTAGAGSGGSSSPSSLASRTSTPSRYSSASSSSFSMHSSEIKETAKTGAATAAAAASTGGGGAAASDVTNSSVTSKQNSGLYGASPLAGAVGSFTGPALNKSALRVPDSDDEDREIERVHLRVQELRWTCAEEAYLDRGDSGQLSLWYPVAISHVIDERSPLYSFVQLPYIAASLKEGPAMVLGSARSDDSSVHPPSLGTNSPEAARHRFQLVAVFDATEMESGSTITAKRTYTTVDIVAHYKFSDRLVHMQQDSGEVMLDFHYFNALLPVDLIELSTTGSEM